MGRFGGGGRSFPRTRSAPLRPPRPRQTVNHAQAFTGGGPLGGLPVESLGMVFARGRSVYQQAVNAVMGARTVHHETLDPGARTDICASDAKTYQDCLKNNRRDTSRCEFYYDMLSQCRRNFNAGGPVRHLGD